MMSSSIEAGKGVGSDPRVCGAASPLPKSDSGGNGRDGIRASCRGKAIAPPSWIISFAPSALESTMVSLESRRRRRARAW
jgi:hypothetical protein